MPGIIPQNGALSHLAAVVTAELASPGMWCHLFQNDLPYSTFQGLTGIVEATFSGYIRHVLQNPKYSIVGGIPQALFDPITFTVGVGGVGNPIYGYYVTDGPATILWGYERDPFPPGQMQNVGDTYTITPRITLESKY